jgi:hypothetical protein
MVLSIHRARPKRYPVLSTELLSEVKDLPLRIALRALARDDTLARGFGQEKGKKTGRSEGKW